LYSSFLGGAAEDRGEGIALDSSGMAYVTGQTASADFPTSPGAFRGKGKFGGAFDVWIAKISSDGKNLIYSTFVGGSADDGPEQAAIIVDAKGYVYVSGYTRSTDFPTSNSAYQKTLRGSIDNFILKLSADGSNLVFSTYFGGGGDCWETAFGAPGVDEQGNVYVSGGTACADFPVTRNPFQSVRRGKNDAFLVKFSADGSKLLHSTYFGGSKGGGARGLALDPFGGVYVIGETRSPDFPTTAKATQKLFQGAGDAFITRFK
jgi:hypothetical protein